MLLLLYIYIKRSSCVHTYVHQKEGEMLHLGRDIIGCVLAMLESANEFIHQSPEDNLRSGISLS